MWSPWGLCGSPCEFQIFPRPIKQYVHQGYLLVWPPRSLKFGMSPRKGFLGLPWKSRSSHVGFLLSYNRQHGLSPGLSGSQINSLRGVSKPQPQPPQRPPDQLKYLGSLSSSAVKTQHLQRRPDKAVDLCSLSDFLAEELIYLSLRLVHVLPGTTFFSSINSAISPLNLTWSLDLTSLLDQVTEIL